MPKKENTTTPKSVSYDEAPAWSADVFKRAKIAEGDRVIREATGTLRRGRPKAEAPKEQVSIRLDPEVLAFFREGGRGWQSRINEALKKAVKA